MADADIHMQNFVIYQHVGRMTIIYEVPIYLTVLFFVHKNFASFVVNLFSLMYQFTVRYLYNQINLDINLSHKRDSIKT